MQKTKPSLLISSILISLGYSCSVLAEEIETTELTNDSASEQLETIVVSGSSFSQQVGTQKITEEQIKRQPTKGGGITDLLKSNPNVRFSNNSDLSTTAGEISPNEVSFHGEKYYNNNFVLDGMSNNDNINPSGNIERNGVPVGSNPYDLPNGNSQSMWVDSGLLKNVEAFDSNISAKYGNFTGGVINAELKDPRFDKEHSGKIYYRTTRDDWTKFYIQEGKEDAFYSATRLDYQPKFVKQSYGFNVSEKLSDKFALMFAYDRTESDIDYYHTRMRNTDNLEEPVPNQQKRTNTTYLFRGVYLPDNGDLWRGTVIYSPHKSRQFKSNVKNGEFTSEGGGLQVNLEWEKELSWGKVKTYTGYKKTGDEIKHQEDSYHRYLASPYFGWISNPSINTDADYQNAGKYATWGGYGSYSTEKEIFTAKQDYDANSFDFWGIEHKFGFGWQIDASRAKYERDSDNALYYYVRSDRVSCGTSGACLDGNQYANKRTLYEARDVSARDNDYAAYLQDSMKWKNLEFTLGARLDHNEFLGNTNLAHRISSSYDIFGDQSTILFGGLNRYYGSSMLAFKLRQGIGSGLSQVRGLNADGTLTDWLTNGTNNAPTKYYMTKVKTPYADEKVLGLSQKLWGSKWTFKWVNRDSRDQFSSSIRIIDGSAYRVLNNDGWTKNDTFTLSIAPLSNYKWQYATIGWDAGLRISSTESNNKYYDVSSVVSEKAVYNGKLINAEDLPSADFNTPWSAFFNLTTEFPAINLTWDQRFTFTEGKKIRVSDERISCNGQSTNARGNYAACGNYVGDVAVYEDQEMGSAFMVDWRFAYKIPTFQEQYFEITLDINNVLNRKQLTKSNSGTSTYKQGRNFWLGASYNW
ncbi:TonB-dependent receptor plug domain-containing protein [Exercitatus varius]|uniref:TonB-dependent receptor plug domain-containing protein n=1 Tax=Exercitatus varius TaxID=67857 RepID=UPI00294B7A6C|nr:TonB-dependent receptor plug domain-containing protein [Exercitatus varius]MDG2941099.1 TonB-dependent receptor plug domain-containing protein [Exercitatus varius]